MSDDKPIGRDAKIALECAKAIMDAFPKKKALDFIGDFNELLLYLEYRVKEENKTQ